MCRLARRLTGSTALGGVAGLLLCFDGLHFVLSRLALLDIFVAFFMLCGVPASSPTATGTAPGWPGAAGAVGGDRAWGPVRGLLFRPWLLLGGISWGLACGTKWEALYPLAAFGLLAWLWSAGARRSFGVRWSVLKSALADGIPPSSSWCWSAWSSTSPAGPAGWSTPTSTRSTSRRRSTPTTTEARTGRPRSRCQGLGEVTQSLRSLWEYHQDVYDFHTHFLNDSDHTYASKPSGWLLLNRPVGVAADTDIQPGTQGCDAAGGQRLPAPGDAARQPVMWWAGILALALRAGDVDRRTRLALRAGGRRHGATWLPWLQYDDRPIFSSTPSSRCRSWCSH